MSDLSEKNDAYSTRGSNTFVPDQPSLNAISWAKSSPKPIMSPFMNGRIKLIAVLLTKLKIVGGLYSMIGELDDEGGEEESSLFP